MIKKFRVGLITVGTLLMALVIIAVGEVLPPMQELEQWMAPRRELLLWITGAAAFAGFCLFMGTVACRVIVGGRSLDRREIEHHVQSTQDGLNRPYASRVSKYSVPDRAIGGEFNDEFTLGQLKQAWRRRLWRTDPQWRFRFLISCGAAVMALGIISVIVVLTTPGIKLLMGGAFLFACIRIVWAFIQA